VSTLAAVVQPPLLCLSDVPTSNLSNVILQQVPGGPNDSLTSNTALGKAVGGACDELEALAALERDAAMQAAELLRKLGYKGDLLSNPPPAPGQQQKKEG